MIRRTFAVCAILASMPIAALAQAVKGEAQVLGADDLAVGGIRFQLWGIDAPEPIQPCFIDGVAWECGTAAARKLAEISALGPLACVRREDPDRTRRAFRYATCVNGQGKDVAEEMVRAGMAYAYRPQAMDYAAAEDAARAAKIGIWRGVSQAPWEWRDLQRN